MIGMFKQEYYRALAGCHTKFLFAVFSKTGALERNAYWFYV